MDFSDVDNASGEVGGEVQEVESKDSDFGDGDGVNDFDDTYNEMNSGNETMEYSSDSDGDGTTSDGEKGEYETTDGAVDDELEDFDDSSDTAVDQEVQAPQETADNVEQNSSLNTDESVDDALSDFDDSADDEQSEDATDVTAESTDNVDAAEDGEASGNDTEETGEASDASEDQQEEVVDADTDNTEDVDTTANEETSESGSEETGEVSDTNETQPEDSADDSVESTDNVDTMEAGEASESGSEETDETTDVSDNQSEEATEANADIAEAVDTTANEETSEDGSEESGEVVDTDESQPEDNADASAESTDNVDTTEAGETSESGSEETGEATDASENQPEELQENAENASNYAGSDANQSTEVNDGTNSNGEDTSDGDIPKPENDEKTAMFENVSYHQGQNDFGARGTCGPTSIANSLNRVTGTSDYTENAVLHNAMDNDLCSKSWNPNAMGGTTTDNVVSIIDNVKSPDSNIHTEVYEYDKALSVDELADKVDNPGTVAMVGVDSATLWDQRGDVVSSGLFQHTEAPSDHWITVDSPTRDSDGNVTGFNIIDSGGGVDYVDRDKFEAMYQGDASHTVSDPTAIIISNQGEATNTYETTDGVERTSNYKGSAVESDGGDPPSEIDAKEAFDVKFAEKREGWVDDDKADSFLATSDMYAQKAVDSGACATTDDFYKMYESGDYSYSQDFVDKVKEPYLETGASSLVSRRDVMNAFDNPRCQHTIGRQEHGNFVTSMKEDVALIYNEDGTLKSSETIEKIKGVDPGKYDDGVYQYSYDSEFVKSCEEKGLVRTVNGDNPGANSLNIPGCQTWAGENVEYSESELLMPSVDVQGYSSDDAFRTIDENGYFEIANPTVVTEEGERVQVNGTFRIYKLGA